MILKGSQRSGGKQLGLHLLKTEENENVEVHEVRGFVSENILGAMHEALALSRGTRCKQYLFSLSLSPPETENVPLQLFEKAIDDIESRLGLSGQPRMIVFHEKEGRRHAHAVWSRIDAETMTAKPLPFFKMTLQDASRQLFLENGWTMPRGLISSEMRDPRNFTLDEWQQAKRAGLEPKMIKETVQHCWAASDNLASFTQALEERGLFLAKGDQRGHVAVTYESEVLSIARLIGKTGKEVAKRLGSPDSLRSVEQTRADIGMGIARRIENHITIAKRRAAEAMKPLLEERQAMKVMHQDKRHKLDLLQRQRSTAEVKERAARFRKGVAGLWDRLTGEHGKIKKRNEFQAFFGLQRDRNQRDALVHAQLDERHELQQRIRAKRRESASVVLALFKDASRYRSMQNGRLRDTFQKKSPDRANLSHVKIEKRRGFHLNR